ncbi:MAG: glutamate--tRNA ligase [Sulfuricurvum sp.]
MIVTRFAPSPTGYLHIGGLRTALYSYLWAKKNGGKFLLRIEDTDKARNSLAAANAIVEAFKWLGLEHDGEIVYQSQRDEIYAKYIKQLLDEGRAYYCYMSKAELEALRESQIANKQRAMYDRRYRDFCGEPPKGVDPVVRIKAPISGEVVVRDGVKGDVVFRCEDILDDFVIARADGSPTYNFVVAIDDALMGVTDVIRGDDHLSNTPKQMVVYDALGFNTPKFYHVPMIHNASGKKLSKRDGATDVMQYKEMGYLPHALLNFLVRLGWSHGDDEIFSMDQMVDLFDPKDINRSASIYNTQKLEWLNAHYIKTSPNEDLVALMSLDVVDDLLLDAIKERAKNTLELDEMAREILNAPLAYDEKDYAKAFKDGVKEVLEGFLISLEESDANSPQEYSDLMQGFVTQQGIGFGKLGQPLRVALLGKLGGAGLDVIMSIIGKDETISRIKKALKS